MLQINRMTAWIDGSFIYSTSEAWVNAMRSFQNGTFLTDETRKLPIRNAARVPLFNSPVPHVLRMMNPERLFCKSCYKLCVWTLLLNTRMILMCPHFFFLFRIFLWEWEFDIHVSLLNAWGPSHKPEPCLVDIRDPVLPVAQCGGRTRTSRASRLARRGSVSTSSSLCGGHTAGIAYVHWLSLEWQKYWLWCTCNLVALHEQMICFNSVETTVVCRQY